MKHKQTTLEREVSNRETRIASGAFISDLYDFQTRGMRSSLTRFLGINMQPFFGERETYLASEASLLGPVVMNFTRTNTGATYVQRSLYPLQDLTREQLQEKHVALRGVESDSDLKKLLYSLVEETRLVEPLFEGSLDKVVQKEHYSGIKKFVENVSNRSLERADFSSVYITRLLKQISALSDTELYGARNETVLTSILKPLRKSKIKTFVSDARWEKAIEGLGKLDELLAFYEFGRALPDSCLPTIDTSAPAYFSAKGLVNAVRVFGKNQVPIDLDIGNGSRITFIEGLNSGGKTNAVLSLMHADRLIKAGCYAPCTEVTTSPHGEVFYQTRGSSSQQLEGGSLERQLKRTKDILNRCSDSSLVILDDLGGTTNVEENTEALYNLVCGFAHKGANTVIVSHDIDLAKRFEKQGVGLFLQPEISEGKPTYRLIQGIPASSHSEIVAGNVGVRKEDITASLVQGGHLRLGQDLHDLSQHALHSTHGMNDFVATTQVNHTEVKNEKHTLQSC